MNRQKFSLIFVVGTTLAGVTGLGGAQAVDRRADEATRAFYRGDLQRARLLAQRHIKLRPGTAHGRVILARVHMAEGNYAQAFDELRKALRAEPDSDDALFYLGQVTKILAQLEFQELMAVAPDSIRAHQFLAESYLGEGKIGEAVGEYEAVLRLDPRSVETLVALADVERARSRYDEAVGYYNRALAIEPHDDATLYGLGLVHFRRGEYSKAIEHFRRCTVVDPGAAVPQMALGMALFHSGDAAGAIVALEKAVRQDATLRQAYTYLARSYHVAGRPQEAKAALQKATELAGQQAASDRRRVRDLQSATEIPVGPGGVDADGLDRAPQ